MSVSQLTFTTADWDTAQTVTVTGVEDDDDSDNENLDVTLTASSTDGDYHGEEETVAVTVDDHNLVAPTEVTVAEGATATFTVALAELPDDDVTVSGLFGRHRQGDGVSESQLTFTTADWDTAQTVTVTGIQDVDDDDENGRCHPVGVLDRQRLRPPGR